MTTLTKLLAATVLSGAALVGSAPAQYLQVRPVPTLTPAPTVLPRPHPNPGPFPPPVIDID